MCKDNCKCNKCKNKFLPISGRDVLYYGLPLEIINVEYGENYEEILIKLNKLISEITTDKESSDLFFSNIGNGIGILKGINEFNQVEFKSLISDGSIDIQTDDKTITLKTIYNFKIVEDVNEANTYLSVENEGKLVYIKQTDKYYKIKNLELSDPFPTKLETPTQDGVDGPEYKVPAYLPDGSAYWRSATDFGKVDTVNNIKPDNNRNVTLKISDLEDDKGLALLSDLNNEINNRINSYNELQQSINTEKSERISADELLNSKIDTTKTELNSSFDNKISQESTERVDADTVLDNKITTERTERIDADKLKLDKPTTVGTTTSHPHVVGVDSNGNSAKLTATDFGKVDGIRVNGIKQPLATDRYVDLNQEFVKNGGGWSTKYKQDNPDKYEITGENAVDLTKAYPNSTKKFGAKGKDSFAVGAYNLAGGMGSLSMGYGTETYGNISIATGYLNKTYSAYTTIFGGSQNTIGTESEITNPITSLNSRAIIAGGQFNSIVNGKGGTIIGGYQNTIDAGNKYNNSTNPLAYNSILGGYLNTINNSENSIIVGGSRNKINQSGEKVITSFVTGQDNETQGSFTTVFGYRNKAVTQGETIVGFGATIQDESLLPTTYYDNSRMFAVGVGILNSNNTLNRRDGLSVYQNGLVTTPTANNNNIENNPKAVTTKEFVDNKISNFSLPTNWSNPFVRYSGLLDKSADATYNKVAVLDSANNLATANYFTSEFVRLQNGSRVGFAMKHRFENPNFYGLIGNQAIDLSLSYSTSSEFGANGYQAIAIGNSIKARGDQSVGIGVLAETSADSVSIGNIVISGYSSVAIGSYSNASGSQATAVGNQAKATGFFSVSIGSSIAIGQRATAVGSGNKASVDYSNALGGSFLNADVYKSVVLGFSNPRKTNQSTTTWIPTDDLFVVGNGNNVINELSEALNLKKNGHLTLPSVTNSMIDTSDKSVITKEYLDIRIPKPPTTGEYALKSINGVVSWVLN